MSDDERVDHGDEPTDGTDSTADVTDRTTDGTERTTDEDTRAGHHSMTDTDDPTETNRPDTNRVRRYVDYALLAGLLFLAFVAVIQFYLSVGSAINTWVTPEYRSLFRALFNLAVLLAVGAGLAYQLRRMDFGGSETK